MALEVQIGADSSDLNKKIKEAELALKELSQVKLERIKLGLDTKEINGNITSVKKSLTELKTVSKDSGNAIAGMAPRVASGSNALMQFSRIAQDAPYGIIGIGNNITATVEAFGYLKNSTGSAGSALKAMAGSLLGSGGILLAVSLVTTALTYMSQNGLTLGDVFNKLTGNFNENLRALRDMNAESVKTASTQTAMVGAYVSAAKNINLSMSDRLIAVKKLQDEYPAYFGNLSREQILNGQVADTVREVAKALIAKAKAAALSGKLAELAEKELLLREKELVALKSLKKARADVGTVRQSSGSMGSLGGAVSVSDIGMINSAKGALSEVQDELRSLVKTQSLYTTEIEKSVAASLRLEKSSKTSGASSTSASATKRGKLSTVSVLGGIDSDKIKAEGKKVIKVFEESLGSELTKFKETKIPLTIPLAPAFDQVKFDEMIGKLSEFDIAANEIIENSISSTFQNLGNVIGEALANGGNVFQSFGKTLISSLGGLISSLGDKLIQLGTAAVLAGTVVKLFGTISGVGAGLAAIAGGVLLKGVGSAISAKGGNGSPETGANYSSPASSSGYSSDGSGMSGGTVVFEISGQSLIGVLSNTLDKNRRLGGSLSF